MKRDGSIFFNFRDIILRHPDNETIQDLFIEIENIEPPEWKICINLNCQYWLKRIGTTMRKNSILRLRRCLPRTIISRKSNSFSSKNPNKIPFFIYGWNPFSKIILFIIISATYFCSLSCHFMPYFSFYCFNISINWNKKVDKPLQILIL